MDVVSLLKSPYALGGAGLAGSGGLGVGGWQIYEEANPSNHKSLSRQGYSWSPIEAPRELRPTGSKFNMESWECAKRLFPDVEIKYTSTSSTASTPSTSPLSKVENPDKFITCAIMEVKPISLEGINKPNQLYFKSEVVVKGSDYGWIMWTFASTVDVKESSNPNKYASSLDFFYRLITLKKTDNKWDVEGGLSWEHYSAQQFDHEKLVLVPPLNGEGWFTAANPRKHRDTSPFRERAWAGIGEVDEKAERGLSQSLSIYNIDNNGDNREFWGTDGEFPDQEGKGYKYVTKFYEKGKGWENRKDGKNISSWLKDWYKPFKDKKIRWSNLGDRCDAWSRIRGQAIASGEEDLRALCYNKPSK